MAHGWRRPAAGADGPQLWRIAIDGTRAERPAQGARPSSPAWMPSGQIACLVRVNGRARIAAPCDAEPLVPVPDVEAVGPIAFSPDGAHVYFAAPNDAGFVDLWQLDRGSQARVAAHRLLARQLRALGVA